MKKGIIMKKKLGFIILAVVLVSISIGGYALSASIHQPITQQKLLGYGPYGYNPTNEDEIFYSLFTITNPDCKNSITVDQIGIIRADGSCIFEYPGDTVQWTSTTIDPHGVRLIALGDYIGTAPGDNEVMFYTVEVSWSSRGKCLPLIGNQVIFQRNYFDDSIFTMSKTRVEMVGFN
jgi:hypothetical protein